MDAAFFQSRSSDGPLLTRRDAMRWSAIWGMAATGAGCALTGAGGATAVGETAAGEDASLARSPRRYRMKKSINLWAFPYPDRMSLQQCLQLAKEV